MALQGVSDYPAWPSIPWMYAAAALYLSTSATPHDSYLCAGHCRPSSGRAMSRHSRTLQPSGQRSQQTRAPSTPQCAPLRHACIERMHSIPFTAHLAVSLACYQAQGVLPAPWQIQDIMQRKASVLAPSDDSRSRDTFARPQHSGRSQHAQQQQQLGRDARLQECVRPPLDWSLKTRALFYSQQPFSVCRDAIMAPAAAGERAWLANSSLANPAYCASGSSACRLLNAACNQAHPSHI